VDQAETAVWAIGPVYRSPQRKEALKLCAKMPIVIESVGDQGQRVEQGFEWPDDSALKRVEKKCGPHTRLLGASFKSKLKARPTMAPRCTHP
jgi:hypothetical protein